MNLITRGQNTLLFRHCRECISKSLSAQVMQNREEDMACKPPMASLSDNTREWRAGEPKMQLPTLVAKSLHATNVPCSDEILPKQK